MVSSLRSLGRRHRLALPLVGLIAVALVVAGALVAKLGRSGAAADQPDATPGRLPANQNTAEPARIVPSSSPRPEQAGRPNLVTVVADDMRADDLRWMPNVRRAGRGPGARLPQLVRELPAVRPGPGLADDRRARAQPPRLLATWSPTASVRSTTAAPSPPASTTPATTRCSSASTSTGTARRTRWSPASRPSATCRRAGPTGARRSTGRRTAASSPAAPTSTSTCS